jgi:hypothetical protein
MRLSVFVALFLFALSSFAGTGHPYNPMTEGQTIKYQVLSFTGTYDAPSMKISVTSQTHLHYNNITFSANSYNSYSTKDLFVLYYHGIGQPSTPINYSAALQDAKWIMPDNFSYIGEMVNQFGNTMLPPEPKIQKTPVAGVTYSGTSVVRSSATNDTIINPAFNWKYRTVEYLPTWGPFADCWRTALHEYNPTSKDSVYNYVWMKNVGLVNFWYGELNGNTVTGYIYHAVEY